MKILSVRNVHEALPRAVQWLRQEGIRRDSRNGPVLMMTSPVTTVYHQPLERVIFWPERDANPFFHLYEALWMLAGRRDVAGVARYAKQIAEYSDDGNVFHAAYGHRWRHMRRNGESYLPLQGDGFDQLPIIAESLRKNPDDRRCVLQMWDADRDLGRTGKDFPCNLMVTFQRGHRGELNIVVFCRSNDIIWGCYGSNAVQFSFLLEYMARWIGCAIGTYSQISVNWHAYVDKFEFIKELRPDRLNYVGNPYESAGIYADPLFTGSVEAADEQIQSLLDDADAGFPSMDNTARGSFFKNARYVLQAHHVWRTETGLARYNNALRILSQAPQGNDWVAAATDWIQRRYQNQLRKAAGVVKTGA